MTACIQFFKQGDLYGKFWLFLIKVLMKGQNKWLKVCIVEVAGKGKMTPFLKMQ